MPADAPQTDRRLTFLGHATVRIDLGGIAILTDPILRTRVAFLRWTGPPVRVEQHRDAAAVLLSHLHRDHTDLPSLTQLGHDRPLLVPAHAIAFFRRRGFTRVIGMRPGDSRPIGSVTVTATDAAHDGRRHPVGPPRGALGFIVTGGASQVYFAGDTDLFPAMRDIGDVDVALLPVSGWGPTLGPGHLDPLRAAEAAARIRARTSVPIHWGALRLVGWRQKPAHTAAPAAAFVAEVRRRELRTDACLVKPGQSFDW